MLGDGTGHNLSAKIAENRRVNEFLLQPAARLLHEIDVKKSRFICLIARVSTPEEARAVVNERKAIMPDARHHCSAFVISVREAQPISHSSDDGEPSGTAGRPMLDILTGARLFDVVAVVTRYFGGTLLGTGGLVRAYSDAVRECLEGAPVVLRDRIPAWSAELPHADAGRYLAELAGIGARVEPEYLADGVRVSLAHPNADAIGNLFARLSSGAIRPQPAGTCVAERPAGTIHDGTPV